MNGQAYLKLTWAQVRLYLREPAALFFTLAFPPMLLLLFRAAFGNAINPTYRVGFVDSYTPALIALVAGTVGLMSPPVKTASDRESGVLKRFQATPLSARVYLLADLTTALGVNLIAVALTVALGFAVYHPAPPRHPLAMAGATVLGGLGYLLAALLPTARTAQAVGSVLFFPMMFLSSTSIPLDLPPPGCNG
ncbi:MAG TPA: ABC transporter permease [Anaerolineae bacterium]|nr:ABC transporter permease [Anaerolineae bacterium]